MGSERSTSVVIAVDPGRGKCGLAVVAGQGVLLRAIIPTAEVGLTCHYLRRQYPDSTFVVGNLTGSREVLCAIREACPEAQLETVEEDMSTLHARARYWTDNPPRGLQRLIPPGMRLPPRPVDDYAAVLLAERYLDQGA